MMDKDGRLYYCYEEDELLDAVEKAFGVSTASKLSGLLEEMRQFFVYVAPNEDIDSQSVIYCKTKDAIREETQEAIKQSVEGGKDEDGKNPGAAEEILAEFDSVKQRDMRIAELERDKQDLKDVLARNQYEASYWRGVAEGYRKTLLILIGAEKV